MQALLGPWRPSDCWRTGSRTSSFMSVHAIPKIAVAGIPEQDVATAPPWYRTVAGSISTPTTVPLCIRTTSSYAWFRHVPCR